MSFKDAAESVIGIKVKQGNYKAAVFTTLHLDGDSGEFKTPTQRQELKADVTTRDAPKSRLQRIREAENRFDRMGDGELNDEIRKLILRNSPELVADGKTIIIPQVGVYPWSKLTLGPVQSPESKS